MGGRARILFGSFVTGTSLSVYRFCEVGSAVLQSGARREPSG
jgi:hypothetical protein